MWSVKQLLVLVVVSLGVVQVCALKEHSVPATSFAVEPVWVPYVARTAQEQEEPPVLLENTAQFFPMQNQVRASYGGRRRMVPYGGFDMTMNPYRRPNAMRFAPQFFTPRTGNAATMGPDPGIGIASIINMQRQLTYNAIHASVYGVPGANGPIGGPGYNYFAQPQRPYGIDPYAGPFTYYSPPPLPTQFPPAVTAADQANGQENPGGG